MGALRILFAGSPAIALPSFRALVDGPFALAGLLTNPDKPRGRSGKPEPTDVAAACETYRAAFAEKGLPSLTILKPETLKAEAREAVAALKPDLLVSFAYGRIFGPQFMVLFPLGGINVHPSLLPKYRGASPIQEAILRRDSVSGICIQTIAPEMDTGNILAKKEIILDGTETTETLSARVAEEAAALLMETLGRIAEAGVVPEGSPQDGEVSYCSLIRKDSGLIDWNMDAQEICAQIRAYTPWPLAYTAHRGETLYILEAAPYMGPYTGPAPEAAGSGRRAGTILCTDKKNGILVQTGGGLLALRRLQYRARKALPWQAFLNGARDFIGAQLGTP